MYQTNQQAWDKVTQVYNNKEVTFIEKQTMDQARQWAIMYCDHSDEIIVREINKKIEI